LSREEQKPEHNPPRADDRYVIDISLKDIERQRSEDKKEQREYERKQLLFNKRLVWFTGLLCLTSAISDVLLNFQMRVAWDSADASRRSADAAASAARTAEANLKSSQKSFQIDQRPYVVLITPPIFIDPPAPNDHPVRANVTFKDIGRTPAIKVVTAIALLRFRGRTVDTYFTFIEGVFADLRKKIEGDKGKYGSFARRDLAPQDTSFSTAEISPLSAQEMLDIGKSSLVLVYVGISAYTDSFGERYETEFCYQYFGTDPRTWHICDSHNTIK